MGEYVFDQAWEQERDRLRGLEGWLDPGTLRHMEALGVRDGWRCLEVGGGGGSVTQWLCDRVGPTGSVVATDLDTRFLQAIDRGNLEVRTHNIVDEQLEEDAFDLAHTRLVLMHLPAREEVLKKMAASLAPGGWLLVEDFDMVTHLPVTPHAVYERVNHAMITLMTGVGVDAYFGRRIAKLLVDLGLEQVDGEGRIPLGQRDDNPGLAMYKLTLSQLKAPMIQTGLTAESDVEEVIELLDDLSFFALPPTTMAVWGRRPASG